MPVRKRRQKGITISNFTFYWSVSSDIVPVKGLIIPIIHVTSASSTRAARRDEDHVGISMVLFSAKKKKRKKET